MKKLIPDKTKDFLFKLSAILILIAAIAYTFNPVVASWIMIIGVLFFTITTFMTPYPGKSFRGKRLYNIQIFGVLFMIISTCLMFVRRNEWVATMLIGALLTLYSAYVLAKVYKKEQEDSTNNDKKRASSTH